MPVIAKNFEPNRVEKIICQTTEYIECTALMFHESTYPECLGENNELFRNGHIEDVQCVRRELVVDLLTEFRVDKNLSWKQGRPGGRRR